MIITYYYNEFFAASMTMDISNHKKLSEFYEEINRLKIKVIRPSINKSFPEFKYDGKNFIYALGAIKNVGVDAIKNIVKERTINGKFSSINDFLNRVNPKDINKLQLEGLVKAGVFDELHENRASLFSSIPKMILKSKNNFENKLANQINLFDDECNTNEDFITNINEWLIQDKLNKEFEALGFFMSGHPLNVYEDIFDQFNIVKYEDILKNENIK